MKVMFEIPIELYHLCLTRFGLKSREYSILQNGVIARDENGNEVVQVLCDEEAARLVRKKLAEVCPELVDKIKERPENSGK
jgi:hypothetical protein